MGQALVRNLDDAVLADFKAAAKAKGSSLEAELRALIVAHRPAVEKDVAALMRISNDALAMTPPDGPTDIRDSTLLIRWDRDTNHGKWLDDGWSDDDVGG